MAEQPIEKTANVALTDDVFACSECDTCFGSKLYLQRHMIDKHGMKIQETHWCPYCPYSSCNRADLTEHLKSHTGPEAYMCHLCLKRFVVKSNLTRHQAVAHSEKSVWECPHCGKRFASGINLTLHTRVHMEDGKAPKCRYCGRCFTEKRDLNRHLLNHCR